MNMVLKHGRATKQRTLKTNSISKTPPARKVEDDIPPVNVVEVPQPRPSSNVPSGQKWETDDNESPSPAYQPEVAEQAATVETDEKYVLSGWVRLSVTNFGHSGLTSGDCLVLAWKHNNENILNYFKCTRI